MDRLIDLLLLAVCTVLVNNDVFGFLNGWSKDLDT